MCKLEKHQPLCPLLRAVMASNDLMDLTPPPPSKPKYLRCCSVAHSAHLCSSEAPGSLSPPDAHIRLVQARSVHPCTRKMSAVYTVLRGPAHLVPRTCSGPRGRMLWAPSIPTASRFCCPFSHHPGWDTRGGHSNH